MRYSSRMKAAIIKRILPPNEESETESVISHSRGRDGRMVASRVPRSLPPSLYGGGPAGTHPSHLGSSSLPMRRSPPPQRQGHRLRIPVVEWRWRIEDIISTGDLSTRDNRRRKKRKERMEPRAQTIPCKARLPATGGRIREATAVTRAPRPKKNMTNPGTRSSDTRRTMPATPQTKAGSVNTNPTILRRVTCTAGGG